MSNLEQKVMANVALIYTVRKAVGRTALKTYVMFLSIIGIVFFVSVPHVVDNFSHVAHGGVGSITAYILAAILGTTIVVQIALLLSAVAFISLIADYARTSRLQLT